MTLEVEDGAALVRAKKASSKEFQEVVTHYRAGLQRPGNRRSHRRVPVDDQSD
jgi:hypothetical protein